jgi:signal peptidase I
MSDANNPYDRPPAPERFEPSTPADAPLPPRQDERYEPVSFSSEPVLPAPPADTNPPDEDRAAPAAALPPLEPLPAVAGDFGTVGREGSDGSSLSSRLVDEFVAWLKTLASAAVYATLIVTFGFQVARVEGQSMAPTLQDQDRLIVNKFAYLTHIGEPQVGDIVMLYYPSNPKKSFVKRVIAAEDQMVRMVNGKVFVDDVPVNDSYVPEEFRGHEDYGPQRIPEGYYFVMGDHRNNSSDSRHWGFVPKKYIIGRVQLRWWPVPEARTF